jgi:hypothetical protein
MILNVDAALFEYYFPLNPHPFLSEAFLNLNSAKVDKVVRLVQDTDKVQMGLVGGIRGNSLLSHFSAPFGGFHFRNEQVYPAVIENFLGDLHEYALGENISDLSITLAPDIYSASSNAKLVNVMMRNGFHSQTPEITNWVDLHSFNSMFSLGVSRTYYNQAVKKNLSFDPVDNVDEMEVIYNLIVANRARMGRPIHMSFKDLEKTANVFATDYFKVMDANRNIIAGAIMYRAHPEVAYAVFWGDNPDGRPVRAMDFLVFHLWSHYKALGYRYIDLGISTERGIPNDGLLRFKETHECVSSLRYTLTKQVKRA